MRFTSLLITAFCVSLIVILAQVFSSDQREPYADEFIYLTIANDLSKTGIFTDARFAESETRELKQPGRFFAPAYPIFLASLAQLDPSTSTFLACYGERGKAQSKNCPAAPVPLLIVQSVISAITMACVFAIALTLSGSQLVATLALVLALATGEAGYYAQMYLTENLAFLGFYLFLAAGVSACTNRSVAAFALSGTALALAALARPSYLYILYVLGVALLLITIFGRRSFPIGWKQTLAFSLAAALFLAPWMARNWLLFGDPALTAGYGGFILVQRVAYNAMTWPEWVVAFVYWLPDFGDSLARDLFPPELYVRLGFIDPSSFYKIGNNELMRETLHFSGGRATHLQYLLDHYVAGDFLRHVLVTFPLTWRGIWAGQYLALFGVLMIVPVAVAMARTNKLPAFTFLVLAPFFMAALHGFVSVNVVRYNIPLIALYSFVVAYVIILVLCRLGWLPQKTISTSAAAA